jgi:hypothetical protein
MECYSEEIIAIAVDGELPADEGRRLRDHLVTCQSCRDLVDALRSENHVLTESLLELPEEAASLVRGPRRRWSWARGDLAILAGVLALGSIVSVWFDELSVPRALEWFNPFSPSGFTNLMFNLSYYFAHGGTAMLTEYAAAVGWLCLLLLLGGSAMLLGRRGRLRYPGLRLLIVLLALSLQGFALELRHSEFVTVGANETIDDTLLAAGNTVRVDGVINGDLMACGRNVEVRGTIKGDLITCSQRTEVSGTVEGNIYTFSNTLDLAGQLGHSIYGVLQFFHLDDRGQVGQGVVVAAGDVSLEGVVKRGVTMIVSGSSDVSGSIGRDLTVMVGGSRGGLTLTNTARIGGNLRARVPQLNDVHIADGAAIAGKRDIQLEVKESHFKRPRFYVHQALWLAGAMLVGWLGLVLFPGFFQATTQLVRSGGRSLGLGIGVLAGAPVAMVIMAITLVGLPLSFMLLALYLTAIYLAKIWVGAFLGQVILRPSAATTGDWMLGLLVGLVILTVVGFIPYLGGLIHLVVVCVGLGAFTWQLYRGSRAVATV